MSTRGIFWWIELSADSARLIKQQSNRCKINLILPEKIYADKKISRYSYVAMMTVSFIIVTASAVFGQDKDEEARKYIVRGMADDKTDLSVTPNIVPYG